jgi:hypothetical protein
VIRTRIAIHNRGDSVADGVTVRITLPRRVLEVEDQRHFLVSPPPPPPKWDRRSGLSGLTSYPAPDVRLPSFNPLGGLRPAPPERHGTFSGPSYKTEGDHVIARFTIAELTHGVTESSTEEMTVVPLDPGTYELAWSAHVGNLREPVTGNLTITVQEQPRSEASLCTLDEVLATHDVPVRDA